MVGEIRDADTAKTAIQASITGHLVLSSFHANSTSAAFSRMIDLIGVNPIFSSSIRLVVAQRLVRKLSSSKKARKITEAEAKYIRKVLAGVSPKWFKGIKDASEVLVSRDSGPVFTDTAMKATKLDKALEAYDEDTVLSEEDLEEFDFGDLVLYDPVPTSKEPFGYSGRMVIMEQLVVSDDMQAFIRGDVADIDTKEIEKVAKKNGMLTLEHKGVLAALRGETTLSEVSRVI